MDIKGAIFDMDGTLVDSLHFWRVFWSKMGERYLSDPAFVPALEDDKQARTMLFSDVMTLLKEKYRMGDSTEEVLAYGNALLASFYENDVKLKVGARELLELLKRKEIPMCVASATTPEKVEKALCLCGIREYFSFVISCAQVGAGKEKPDVFAAALEKLGTPLENTFVFEDSWVALRSAQKYGFQTVGVFDENNFFQDKIQENATVYLGKDKTFFHLIEEWDK